MSLKNVMMSLLAAMTLTSGAAEPFAAPPKDAWKVELLKQPIRSYCIDFNWVLKKDGNVFPESGHWADADPAAHVKWYKEIGANCIQTFILSANGYAWYKGGPIPEQSGLKHDFLPEVVRLGHKESMLVMGYYCIGANTLWGKLHPEQSYGTPSWMHIPLTKEYIDYLCVSVEDVLKRVDIDGFMLDWMVNTSGEWLDCEKTMYAELMGAPFPGADKVTPADLEKFNALAVKRCWTRVRDTARKIKPDCILWPNGLNHLNLEGVDWLLNEGPDVETTEAARLKLNGRPVRLIQNQVGWRSHDARKVFCNPVHRARDFYGFAAPYDNGLPLPVAEYLSKPVEAFKAVDKMTINDRNIAALIRFYLGKPVEPPPPWPEALRCEYLENPLGIDAAKPRLSWKIETSAFATLPADKTADKGNSKLETRNLDTSTRGIKQTAYQVLVASSRALLLKDQGDLWDSGKVESDQSVNVEYAGKPLTSRMQCFWKVKVWTAKLETGNLKLGKTECSGWSMPALWSIGLLDPSGWKGEWIRFKEADNSKHIWYRKSFKLERVPNNAFAYLCSIGYHELYVNGQKIGTRVLSPGVTDLEKRALYITYDIKSKLKNGDNVIAVWTGPGWARSDGSFGKGVWKQDSIFKCQVNMSNGMELQTDATWKCTISSSENLGLWKGGGAGEYGGELIDARRDIPGWNQPSYDDAGWSNATCYAKSLILSAEMQEPDRKVETLKPVSIQETNGCYRIDMGRNYTGWFEIDLRKGKAGDIVKIMTANRKEVTVEYKQESHYIFDASGQGTFCHRFNYMAGRWVTLQGLSYKPEPKDIRGYIVTNDRKRIGHFKCSNDLFNEIYETDLRTYVACSVNGVTMDCPHRERFGYGEVALACTWGCAIPNFESAPYYRKAARDWFDVQREDGFVNTIAPQVYKGAGGTLWSSAPVTLSWEFYKAYGDRRFLEEAYVPMKKWLDFLNKSVSSNGVLVSYEKAARFLGDWATPHGSEYGHTPEAKLFNNCVYAYCLDVLVQSAAILNKPEDVATYSTRLANLRKSAHQHFFNTDTKTYIDGRQLAMAFPLYTGITPESEKKAVFDHFVKEISINKPYLDTGSSGLPILLKYLVEDAERADLLYTCLVRTDYPSYGYFLKCGETTWPEYWKLHDEPSRIHTCYTGIAGYFMKALGGIRPDPVAYGMQKFIIKPMIVGDLSWVKSQHDSLYGRIVSNWKIEGRNPKLGTEKLTMDITIPLNTTATVYVPAKDVAAVTESGRHAAEAEGVKFLRMENGAAVYEVGSGCYQFTAR